MRHIAACDNASLPGERLAFRLGFEEAPVGWLRPGVAAFARKFPGVEDTFDGVTLTDPRALRDFSHALIAEGHGRWRAEAFDVRAYPEGPVLGVIDRGLLPVLGIQAHGVHVNGLVRGEDGWRLWVAVRSASKLLDPNKLDHIVAGGVPSGLTPWQTLVKEAAEEAAVPAELAATAKLVGQIDYAMERAEGLRRDRLHCFDLELPADFVPRPDDGEVSEFALWPLSHALEVVRDTDAFKFNVNLVLIDLFLRRRLITGEEAAPLRAALRADRRRPR